MQLFLSSAWLQFNLGMNLNKLSCIDERRFTKNSSGFQTVPLRSVLLIFPAGMHVPIT